MAASMDELVRALQEHLLALDAACKARRWVVGVDASKGILSAASKLHQRLRVLVDVGEDAAYAAAEVDRALARAEQWHQTTVDEQLADPPKKPTTRGRGKGKA